MFYDLYQRSRIVKPKIESVIHIPARRPGVHNLIVLVDDILEYTRFTECIDPVIVLVLIDEPFKLCDIFR
ncbi:MAG: hypothetical protein BWY45_03408 [Euryarchaeota archaeon ADurb.Bin294]|nr:MAG: hypothetical protein BWY45_03408 [Euryarchaeota archaeon ADurb.Bin294]